MNDLAEAIELRQAIQDLNRLKRVLDVTDAEEIADYLPQVKNELRRVERKIDAVSILEQSKQRRAQMRTSNTYNNKALTRNTSLRYENKAMMQRQIGEIKASIHGQYAMQFNERYDELAHDPEQQEAFVGWYHTRLRNGKVGF